MTLPEQMKKMVQRINSGAFQIVGLPRGEVSARFSSRARAEAWLETNADRIQKLQHRKVRPCLRCSTPFESEGAHNRMCGRCRCLGGDPIPDAFRNPRKRYA